MVTAHSLHPKSRSLIVSRPLLTMSLPVASASVLALLTPEARSVVLPTLALVNLSLLFVATLWHRDGAVPVFELGMLCVMATALYAVFPLLIFLSSGITWTLLSDDRLFEYNPSPEDVGGFAWRHVLYLLSFVVTYLYTRGKASCQQAPLKMPNHIIQTVVISLFLALTV